jgi:peptidoglycan/xylan/chitin deacetylase (PgdA/CDA1 family)
MSRRALASSLASRFKLVSLLERVAMRPGLIVILYHRIARPEDCVYDRAVIEATPDVFDEQMKMLRRRHSVVGPDELREIVERPSSLRHLRVAITFDDGYRDNYSVAFPILRSHGLSALFFLATQFVGSHELTWWDRIAYAVRHTKRSQITLELPVPVTVTIEPRDRERAIQTVLRAFKRGGQVDGPTFLAMLERVCEVTIPTQAEERQFLSWEEALEMQRGGMGIGSHTHSHRILASLGRDEQRSELETSRRHLLERGLTAADFIAYPVGGPDAFSETTKREAKAAGFRVAFSNYGGTNLRGRVDPLDVRRIGIGVTEDTAQLRFRLAASATAGRAVW